MPIIYSLKYYSIIFCCFYTYTKLLNIKHKKIHYLYFVLCSAVGATLMGVVRVNVPILTIATEFIITISFLKLLYRKPINITITYSAISYAIGYMSFFLSMVIIYLFLSPIFILHPHLNERETLYCDIATGIGLIFIQPILIFFLFKIKRLKKGIPQFTKFASGDFGVIASVLVLLVTSLIHIDGDSDILIIVGVSTAVIFGVALLLWWRKHITSVYLEKVHKRNVELLENMLNTQTAEIELLKKDNERLAKIIHKDNKLIPAMELAVRQTLENTDSHKANSAELLSQLERLSGERKGILQSYENTDKSLPETKVPFIDALLKYMAQKCASEDVDFQVMVNADVSALIKDEISQSDLYTLVADLTENAIIATRYSERKKVLLGFEFENEHYRVDVFDSGIPFEPATLAKIGRTKTTTHKENGGSGIGMMTTFELMERYNASLLIDENLTNDLYCKKVCVIFDKEHKFLINSTRKKVLDLKFRRDDVTFISDTEN